MIWSNPFLCIVISHMFFQAQICMNDYFNPNSFSAEGDNFVFSCTLSWTTDEVEHPWCISSHCRFLGVWRSKFEIFRSTRRSSMCEQRVEITALYLITIYIEIFGVVDKSIYLLLFYKTIHGPSGTCKCSFFPLADAFLGQSEYFIFRLSARPFSESFSEVNAPSICFLPRLEHLDSPFYFCFKVIHQHPGYLIVLASQPCTVWKITWGICSILVGTFFPSISPTFL